MSVLTTMFTLALVAVMASVVFTTVSVSGNMNCSCEQGSGTATCSVGDAVETIKTILHYTGMSLGDIAKPLMCPQLDMCRSDGALTAHIRNFDQFTC
jgi:hypothetical protein